MPITAPMEDRLTELEIKLSFQEDMLEQLNAIIVRQQDEIALLMREMLQLRQQMPEGGSSPARVQDELPPHY